MPKTITLTDKQIVAVVLAINCVKAINNNNEAMGEAAFQMFCHYGDVAEGVKADAQAVWTQLSDEFQALMVAEKERLLNKVTEDAAKKNITPIAGEEGFHA